MMEAEKIHSPEGVRLLMENVWLRHKVGMEQRRNNVFMVELPPLTEEEKETIRLADEEAARLEAEENENKNYHPMNLLNMNFEERLAMMRKRQAFLSQFTEGCSTFEDFIKANDEKLAVMGIELKHTPGNDHHITLWIQLDYCFYEAYHVVHAVNGGLEISNIIWWEDMCNELLDISDPSNDVDSDEW